MTQDYIFVGKNRNAFEAVQESFDTSKYHKVENIKRIVVYWESN